MVRSIRFSAIAVSIAILVAGCSIIQPSQPAAPVVLAPPTSQTPASSASPMAQKASPSQIPNSGKSDSILLTLVQGKSEARYRVREQLANVSLPSDAIGRT